MYTSAGLKVIQDWRMKDVIGDGTFQLRVQVFKENIKVVS